MISDVLSDAVSQLRRYQEEFPETYDDVKEDLNIIVYIMDYARSRLDSPYQEVCNSDHFLIIPSIKEAISKLKVECNG